MIHQNTWVSEKYWFVQSKEFSEKVFVLRQLLQNHLFSPFMIISTLDSLLHLLVDSEVSLFWLARQRSLFYVVIQRVRSSHKYQMNAQQKWDKKEKDENKYQKDSHVTNSFFMSEQLKRNYNYPSQHQKKNHNKYQSLIINKKMKITRQGINCSIDSSLVVLSVC